MKIKDNNFTFPLVNNQLQLSYLKSRSSSPCSSRYRDAQGAHRFPRTMNTYVEFMLRMTRVPAPHVFKCFLLKSFMDSQQKWVL